MKVRKVALATNSNLSTKIIKTEIKNKELNRKAKRAFLKGRALKGKQPLKPKLK